MVLGLVSGEWDRFEVARGLNEPLVHVVLDRGGWDRDSTTAYVQEWRGGSMSPSPDWSTISTPRS